MPSVRVQPQGLTRVIINLVSNACDTLKEKSAKQIAGFEPQIHISSALEKEHLVLSFKDNGDGISPAHIEKIFEPFFTTKPTGRGNTGLGLSISYDIITKGHQGELTVDSQEGEWTKFSIKLPLG